MKISSCVRCGFSLLRNVFLKLKHGEKYTCPLIMSCPISSHIEVNKGGELHIGAHLSAQRNLVLTVRQKATVYIGKNVQFNYDCILVSRQSIKIGNNVLFGPGCKIYDHDHDYTKLGKERRENFVSDDIIIGNGCWFGADCIILKGTKIGDNCVFGAGSIIHGEYADNMVIVQKKDIITKSITYLHKE